MGLFRGPQLRKPGEPLRHRLGWRPRFPRPHRRALRGQRSRLLRRSAHSRRQLPHSPPAPPVRPQSVKDMTLSKIPRTLFVRGGKEHEIHFFAEIVEAEFVFLEGVNVGFFGAEDEFRSLGFRSGTGGPGAGGGAAGDWFSRGGFWFRGGAWAGRDFGLNGAGAAADDYSHGFIGFEPADVSRVFEGDGEVFLEGLDFIGVVFFGGSAGLGRDAWGFIVEFIIEARLRRP